MNQIVLNEEILDKIKSDPTLKEKVATALGISVNSMPRLLYGNDPKLTQAAPLKVLKEYLKIKNDKQLFAQRQISAVA